MSANINLLDPIFHDEDAARAWLEEVRWPDGAYCGHCGSPDVTCMGGEAHRKGLFNCRACRKQFSVTVGTVFHRSHVPLAKWVLANHLMNASKKGISAHQLMRTIGVTYKTAWFMAHRLREAMTEAFPGQIGGEGKVVEADEMYHGQVEVPVERSRGRIPKPTKKGRSGPADKRAVVALVERGGQARAFAMTGKAVTAANVGEVLRKFADSKSRLHTDESGIYPAAGKGFAAHETVNHSAKEYVRGDVTTNTVEGFFGVFKRGFKGIYQHCGEQHFQRYVNEFTFRYNYRVKLGYSDLDRAVIAMRGIEGKRLTYRRIDAA